MKFLVFKEGKAPDTLDLQASYLVGPDEMPLRGRIQYVEGVINCELNTDDAAALALMWEVKGSGKFLLQTTRLANRAAPYVLNVELARWRLMRLMQKLEDWSLFDYQPMQSINDLISKARSLFVRAVQSAENPTDAAELANESLEVSIEAGESLAKFHATKMLTPRFSQGGPARKIFGCRLDQSMQADEIPVESLGSLSFVQVPVSWAELQPAAKTFSFGKLDRWFEFLLKRRITIKLSSVIKLQESCVPDWLKTGKIDFETLRDLVYDYLSHIANRYGKYIRSWIILSGVHAENYFNLNFDQILELTRLASLRAKQLCPRAASIIEIVCPWGEYYVRNLRSIHPFLYADMVAQSGINFDGFALHMPFGAAKEGMYTRDFLQISSLVDRYSILGKPLHIITAAPSRSTSAEAHSEDLSEGYWGSPWSEEIQASWLETFYRLALSKSLVESITWDCLSDSCTESIPFSGLFTKDWVIKPAFAAMCELQRELAETRTNLRPET